MNIGTLKHSVYVLDSIVKTGAGLFDVENSIICGGSVSISGGTDANQITHEGIFPEYSIKCAGPLTLENGGSRGILRAPSIITNNWDKHSYAYFADSSPMPLKVRDLNGYHEYLKSLVVTGTSTGTATLTLKGSNTKNVNVFDITSEQLLIASTIILNIPSKATALIRLKSGTLTGITMNIGSASASNVLIISDSDINMSNSRLYGTLFIPMYDLIVNNSTVHGGVYSKSITSDIGGVEVKHAPFSGYIANPAPPTLSITPKSSTGIYNPIEVSITTSKNLEPYYEIRYTLDGSTPDSNSFKYVNSFELYDVGIIKVTAKVIGVGFSDGDLVSSVYEFKCKVETPVITINPKTNSYSISCATPNCDIYYTLDGTPPTRRDMKYDSTSFALNFEQEDEYQVTAIAFNDVCDDSDIAEVTVIVDYNDATKLEVPLIELQLDGSTIISNPPDSTWVSDVRYTLDELKRMNVRLTSIGNTIHYTVNGEMPNSETPKSLSVAEIPLYKIGVSPIKYYASRSKCDSSSIKSQLFFILLRNGDSAVLDASKSKNRSEALMDSMQSSSRYAIDISWVGSGIVTDDVAVYQSLINILSTNKFERIFNPRFGVSISGKLAEIYDTLDPIETLNTLKSEVESCDPRIQIIASESSLRFDERNGMLVVDIQWINRVTGTKAYVAYGYDIDGPA